MTSAVATIQLAQLDVCRPAALDPAVWNRNLAALAADQPQLADELQRVSLPPTWRPALALDDFITWRVEQPGQPASWLAGTAAPATRARSLLSRFDHGGKNPALPCLGASGELHVLLEQLPEHVAVFVFEADLRVLAAILRAHDLAVEISRGRCIFVPPHSEAEFLNGLLEAQPGLLPPGDILLPNLVPPTRVEELRKTCEHALATTIARRSTRLQDLATHRKAARVAEALPSQPRLAVVSLNPDPLSRTIVGRLERAASQLGWGVRCCVVTDPRTVHPLVHCLALDDFQPDLTICIDHPPSRLAVPPPGRTCAWILGEASATLERPESHVLYLATTPAVTARLRRAGLPQRAVLDWYWACELPEDEAGVAPSPTAAILVADLPDSAAKSCGVRHSAHQLLWRQLGEVVSRYWETPRILEPHKLLVVAERQCGVQVTDAALRESLLQLVERVLIPATVADRLAKALSAAYGRIQVLGRGWDRFPGGGLDILAPDLIALTQQGVALRPEACVVAQLGDMLGLTLLTAAARGWPLLVHAPGGRDLSPLLGGLMQPGRHFAPFSDLSGLRQALQALRESPPSIRERVDRARRHALENHSYQRRLLDLAAHLRRGDAA